MGREEFVRRVWIDAPAEEVFAWHAGPGAFDRLTPPWLRVDVVERTGGVEEGAQTVLLVPMGPFRKRWTLVRQDCVDGRQFCDVQVEGPFRLWKHTHRVVPEGNRRCYLEDRVEYALPLGPAGRLLGGRVVRGKLNRLFDHRHRVLVQDLKTRRRYSGRGRLRILVSGSSGLLGSALVPLLKAAGHTVQRLVRTRPADGMPGTEEVYWDPTGIVDTSDLDGLDAVVHLAGEDISAGRWTEEVKQRIRESRVAGTRLLSETLVCLRQPPKILVCASAVGYYGDRGDEILTEDSGAGTGFLSEVCREWEAASQTATKHGIRVVNLRFGMVLSPPGRCACQDAPALPAGRRRQVGKRRAVYELDIGGGCGEGHLPRGADRGTVGPGEWRGPPGGDERGIREDAGARAETSGSSPGPRPCAAADVRGDGGRAAAFQRPGRASGPEGVGIPLPTSGVGPCPAARAGKIEAEAQGSRGAGGRGAEEKEAGGRVWV